MTSAAIIAERLVKHFGPQEALSGISFEVKEGELYGLIGPDGAGKTTTIRALAGLIDVDSGCSRILDADPLRQGSKVREALGLMPQYYSLYGDLTVGENLRFFGRLYCLPRKTFTTRRERLLEITRLSTFINRRADALSGGMYKKLALACALLHQPKVLLLDEPTNGVDPISRRELWELLYEFVAEGMSVLVSTPYMDEAERCHRVGLIHRGRILDQGDPMTLVRQLCHEAYEVSGDQRDALDEVLSTLPEVSLISPAGEQLRIVITEGNSEIVSQAIASLGGQLHPTSRTFEDLFLVRMAEMDHDMDHDGNSESEVAA